MVSRRQVSGELRERFYQSVAETLSLLRAAPGPDRQLTLLQVSEILAVTMDLPLVWIGRREPELTEVSVLAAAGPAKDYASALRLSSDEREPEGCGPVGIVLREESARVMPVTAAAFAPWQATARQYAFGACIVAASRTHDHGQLVLATYSRASGPALGEELLDWAQRLVDELSRFWDHQVLLERSQRMGRYRDAQRTIQRALLEQPDPEAVYWTLARALAEIAGAAAVDVLAADGAHGMLRRVALIGPIADVVLGLPLPPQHQEGPAIQAPTLAFMQGKPVLRRHPRDAAQANTAWRAELLGRAGAVGCWPLFALPSAEPDLPPVPAGVFVVITAEMDAFDEELCRLLDEVADAAGLALRQHAQRHALLQEQERQTYLAAHDDLTGLPNRRALDLYLDTVLARAQRRSRRFALGLLDLDDLKLINDSLGHAAGDHILVEVADRLRQVLRGNDYVARLGGDEFVLVLENFERDEDLDGLLERVGASLQQLMTIDNEVLSVSASLGVAMYSSEAPVSGEQLLRRADQTMYQVKARKQHRLRWWSMTLPDGELEETAELHANLAPYGEQAAVVLGACQEAWLPRLPAIVESYNAALFEHEGVGWLLGLLPEPQFLSFKTHVLQHVEMLIQADLDQTSHRARATGSGMFHAACGVEEVWLLESIEKLRYSLAAALGHPDRRALEMVLQRLGAERQWQLESMRALQRQRVGLLARLNALAWSAEVYLELIQGVVDILVSHPEIRACAVGRPDVSGQLTYEAVAGASFARFLRAVAAGEALPARVDAGYPGGDGPSGRAWRAATIQRCAHYGSDPAMEGGRDVALRMGVISSVAIPLCPSPAKPVAVLSLYSAYPGGFHSEDQQAFVEQIKSVLDLALARLAPPRQGAELLPFFVRERWRAMVATDALQMYYQPLMRLVDGQVTEFEALARLRDEDGALLAPARFLPALSADDLIGLFRYALGQAAACRKSLQQLGYTLDMSVNAPAAAMADSRYAAAAAAVITESGCPARALLLEILESPIGTEHAALLGDPGMQSLQALGVRLVEDDLGAGYSSLIRLRQWPFDRIKIDQAIVLQVRQDPLGTLRFIRQLIRIGHELRLEVVVEGLESAGLIEAAMILGADFGQGYALARPMPVDAVHAWLVQHKYDGDRSVPRTALGALAGELRWEEQFILLPAEAVFWARHAQESCAPGEYLHDAEPDGALRAAHEAMHVAALAGPSDSAYQHQRETFVALLVARVLGEEVSQLTPL